MGELRALEDAAHERGYADGKSSVRHDVAMALTESATLYDALVRLCEIAELEEKDTEEVLRNYDRIAGGG